MAESYIADLHVHLSLKAANNENIKTIWDEDNNPKPKEFYPFLNVFRKIILQNSVRNMATFTQSNLSKCVGGNVRLIFCTIYPVERQYVDRNNFFTTVISKLFVFSTGFPFIKLLSRKKYFLTSLIQMLMGASKSRALVFWDEQESRNSKSINYYKDYKHELNYLIEKSKTSPPETFKDYEFKMLRNFSELKANINQDKIICGIANLEGIHGIGKFRFRDIFKNWNASDQHFNQSIDSIKLNLDEIKKDLRYRLFYITLSHHFNNLIFGQAQSFRGAMAKLLVQKEGLNQGIKDEGWDLIKNHILSRENGYRILIDIKHMSIKSRMEYFKFIRESRENGDTIPIISSHSAVNGIKFFNDALKGDKDGKKNKKSYVSQWNVNLTDEDIVNIHRSDGIIGILMHDGRMPGERFMEELKKVDRQPDRKNLLHQQMFLTNVYHIIRVIKDADDANGWERVCLGSDMDGIVDPFDNYATADRLDDFKVDLKRYLDEYPARSDTNYPIVDLYDQSRFLSNSEVEALNQGLSTEDIVDRIFSKNIETFLSKYFTELYLTGNEE